jgi:KaiC/GvpD/RAD55 family RecA-like ATPase
MTRIETALSEKKTIVFLVSGSDYIRYMSVLVKTAAAINERVCYVTLNRPYKALMESFSQQQAMTERIFFIDAATKEQDQADDEQVVFVSSSKALTEIVVTIKKVAEAGEIEWIIFDSLSTLLMYEEPGTVLKFVHSMTSSLGLEAGMVFTLIKNEASQKLLKDLAMFVDDVIEMAG